MRPFITRTKLIKRKYWRNYLELKLHRQQRRSHAKELIASIEQSRNCWKKPTLPVFSVKKKLRRLSTVGSKTRRRPLESSPAAFFLFQVACVLQVDQHGWRKRHRERVVLPY